MTVCELAYSCMRKLFAPHAAGPVVWLKNPMETGGLGFQPTLRLYCAVCVCLVCDGDGVHSCVTCQTQCVGGGAVTHPTTQ